MDTKKLLEDLCTAHCPSGMEQWIYPLIKKQFKDFGEVYKGNLDNICIHQKGEGKFKVMLMAHADEVFLMVTGIEKGGFLEFTGVGIDVKTLISQEVVVHGSEKIKGIIAIKPDCINESSDKGKALGIESLLIDTGYGDEYIKSHVKIGDYITIKRNFYELLNDNVTCKAVDDRSGIASMYECAKELQNVKHDADVYFVCSCQEEVGHRGAGPASYSIKPDIGIAIDVTFDGGKFGDEIRENRLGMGPVICVGPNIHPRLKDTIVKCAKKYDIPYQIEVEPGNTGTDAWDIQVSGSGIPCLLVSIPIKYMHTSVEIVNIQDIKNTGKLIAKFIEELNHVELEELLCY